MSNCNTCPSNNSCNKNKKECNIENNPRNKIKNVIGVMSGKGGVGKSTISVLIAKELKSLGYKVGILDADITGPSIPRLLGLKDKKATMSIDKEILPVETKDGIKVISLNLMIDNEDDPVIWRGPIVSSAVKQFWTDVLWGELDYLIIDMPPGTGDVALTVMQFIPISGLVMVSIPQDLVSMIVAKAVKMARTSDVKVIGIVENMSYIVCPDCNKKIKLFNGENIDNFLKEMDLELLGELPMIASISNLEREHEEVPKEIEESLKEIVIKIEKSLDNK
ncbi:Mrp/NBP35 family ATP-binding protein [Tissierella sp. MSJ-40]|uniref:Iron-sulfur cluster carrier protein n=1 Tax=Tissierella simiarum TaxID=2841534 RepID=A0ABS6E2E1_9FIRM|nr:Mrp/NBP35 family ATP-binding protein [Tissierella simiarum]MBU5437072.1 Mrp/NBP35 family ATP-binding protein [Tissierella simiarum]